MKSCAELAARYRDGGDVPKDLARAADRQEVLLSFGIGLVFSVASIAVVNVVLFLVYLQLVLPYPRLPWAAVGAANA